MATIQFEIHTVDGRLHDWPLPDATPTHGDLLELPSGRYQVIRRVWDLSRARQTKLLVYVQALPSYDQRTEEPSGIWPE